MHVHSDRKKLKDGRARTYLSLVQSVWVEGANGKKTSKPIVFARLGVEEELAPEVVGAARDALDQYLQKRLEREGRTAASVRRAADEAVPAASVIKVLASRQYGMRVLADNVWKTLGLNRRVRRIAARHDFSFDLERMVFGMVLNRLVDPQSKLACNQWLQETAYMPEADGWDVHQFYKALDTLEEHEEEVLETLFEAAIEHVDPDELSLLLLDTTSTYIETDYDDRDRAAIAEAWASFDAGEGPKPSMPRPQVVNKPPLRLRGHSKDRRPDKPQVVIGAIATRSGRLLTHKVYPGNRQDQTVPQDLLPTVLGMLPHARVVVVMDSGTGGSPNLAALDALDNPPDRVTAVPLRTLKFAEERVLSRPGRWRNWPNKAHMSYRVVEVSAEDSLSDRAELWVATRNSKEVDRVHRRLDKHVAHVRAVLEKSDRLVDHNKALCALQTDRTYKRYVRPSKNGRRLLLDRERIRLERRRAGVKVVRSTLVDLPALSSLECYAAQLGLEADFRTFKTPLRLRPMYHRKAQRIRAHVLVCALSLAVTQELRHATGLTLQRLRALFGNVQAVQMQRGATQHWQRQEWTDEQREVLAALEIGEGPVCWGAKRVGGSAVEGGADM